MSTGQFAEEAAKLLGLTAKQVKAIMDVWIRGPYPGVFDLIEQLNQRPAQTACLSNTNDNHWQQVTSRADPNYLPLEKLNYRFVSHLIGHAKPSAEIYRHVEGGTGTTPESILFFDDLPDNTESASRRGWIAHRIEHDGDPITQIRKHLAIHGLL